MTRFSAICQAITLAGLTMPLLASRTPPKPVPPIQRDGVEYTAPHDTLMGLVAAKEIKTGVILWQKQIYTVRIDPKLEADVQHVYITDLKIHRGKLQVNAEDGRAYALDLKTLQVDLLKGNSSKRNLKK